MMPPVAPRRRRLQFGLRTALILIAVCSAALAFWKHYAAPYHEQQQAITALSKQGVGVQTRSAAGPAWLRWLVGEKRFVEVQYVGLSTAEWFNRGEGAYDKIDDRMLAQCGRLIGAETITAPGPNVTDAGLVHLRGLKGLKSLGLSHSAVTDEGLVHLGTLKDLKSLGLRDTSITDAGLVHLESLASLEKLDLQGTKVTDDGVARLQRSLPACKIAR